MLKHSVPPGDTRVMPMRRPKLADAENISKGYVSRILRLALLAPGHRRGDPRRELGCGAGGTGPAARSRNWTV